MSAVAAGILIGLLVPCAVMAWATVRAFTSRTRLTVEATAELPPAHRRWLRVVGFGGVPLVLLGGVAGMLLRPMPNLFASELIGCGVAGAVWIVAIWTIALRAAHRGSDTPSST